MKTPERNNQQTEHPTFEEAKLTMPYTDSFQSATSLARKNAVPAPTDTGGNALNRRGFLGALAAMPCLLLLGEKNAAARSAQPKTVVLCRCFVAGFQYHQGPSLLPKLAADQTLILKREPTNPYDPLAIAVHAATGGKLGYLPRRLNEIPSHLMDSGHPLAAVIAEVARNAPPWEKIEMEIRLG